MSYFENKGAHVLGNGAIRVVMRAIQAGAVDIIVKLFQRERVLEAVTYNNRLGGEDYIERLEGETTMNSIGICRQVDEHGRIVLPIELRRVLGMNEGDYIEIFADDDAKRMMLRKYRTGCLFCNSMAMLSYFKEWYICRSCLRDMELESKVMVESADLNIREETAERNPRGIKVESMRRLAEIMQANPNATQNEWGKILGISQGYVSQLIRKINEIR